MVAGEEFGSMAAGGGDDHISVDDSDRENFRRRGRSPASKRALDVERRPEHLERERGDNNEIARRSELGDNGRREQSLASNRGGSGRGRERSEQEIVRGSERRREGRRKRGSGSIDGRMHESDEDIKLERGAGREVNGRRRDRSPIRRGGFPCRDRERSEPARGSERRGSWRRDRSPLARRGASRERERGEHNQGRGFGGGDNGRKEISPRSTTEDIRDRAGRREGDVLRGGLERGGQVRRDISPETRVRTNRERHGGDNDSARVGFARGDHLRRDTSPKSNDGIEREREGRDPNSDVDSPRDITQTSLSPRGKDVDSTIIQKDGRAKNYERRRHHRQDLGLKLSQESSDSESVGRNSADEDKGRGDPEEIRGGKPQLLSKIAVEDRKNATSDDDDGDTREECAGGDRKPNDVQSGESDEEEGEDEDRDAKQATKRRSGRREKLTRDYEENPANRVRGSRKVDVDNVHSTSERSEDEETDDSRARREKWKRREKQKRQSRKHSSRSRGKKRKHRRKETSSDDASESESASASSSDLSDSEQSAQREKAKKQRKKRRKVKERELERERKRKLKKKMKELKEKKLKVELKKKKREMRSKKPITSSWGKYGILKDIDMWNKKPEFSAWLAEVKKVNAETLTNWEEKQMFKEYMEDYNTATFPSKKYYNLDIYHRRKITKERMKGVAKALVNVERTDFNDEDERRVELQKEREQRKEAEVEALMRKMQSGMAQDMKEQAQLREEMQYQYRLGNTEAAQAIQRRLEPDAEKFTK